MLQKIQAEQSRNQLRTTFLMLALFALLFCVGTLLMGWSGLLLAAMIGAFSMLLAYRVPTKVIMRRIYRAQAVNAYQLVDLQHLTQQFSRKIGLKKVPQLYYIPSNQLNAFAIGTKEDPAIALTYGLLRSMPFKEISGVIAHELSHIANNDLSLQRMALVMNRLTKSFSLLGQLLLIINFSTFLTGNLQISWVAILLLIFAPYLSNLIQMAISRTREFDADLAAVKTTGDPNGLADALTRLKLMDRRRMNPLQKRLPVWLNTHPQLEERIERLRALAPRFQLQWPV